MMFLTERDGLVLASVVAFGLYILSKLLSISTILRFVNVNLFRVFADGVYPLFSILAMVLPILALGMITLRVFAIMGNRPSVARICWNLLLLIFAVTNAYFYLDSVDLFKPPSNCTPSETNICFEVYDMRKSPVWPFATFVYLSIGTVGIIAKIVYTTFKCKGLSHNVREVDHI